MLLGHSIALGRTKMQTDKATARKPASRVLPVFATIVVLGILILVSRSNIAPLTPTAAVAMTDDCQRGRQGECIPGTARCQALESTFDFDAPKLVVELPVTFVPRNGLLGELTKRNVQPSEVVAAVVSKEGYQKVIDIMNADDQIIKDKRMRQFGTENFYIAFFAHPGDEAVDAAIRRPSPGSM